MVLIYAKGILHVLEDRVDTWYVKLKLSLVYDREHLVLLFNTKSHRGNVHSNQARKNASILREDLDEYLNGFHEKALDCCNLVAQAVLDVYLSGLMEEYQIFLENLSFFVLLHVNGGCMVYRRVSTKDVRFSPQPEPSQWGIYA